MSRFFTSGGRSIGVSASASVLPVNFQDLFPLGWTGSISLLSKRLSRVLVRNELLNFDPWSILLSGETAETFLLDCLEASFAAILCRTPFYLPHGCIPYSSAASHLLGSSSLTSLVSLPRPTRPRNWCSCDSPNLSAFSITITEALGTSTPTSITVVETSICVSPDAKRRI